MTVSLAPGRIRGRAARASTSMLRWLLIRLGTGVATLFVVSVLIFLATQALPGDVAHIILGKTATPDQLRILRDQLGLDQPLVVQYVHWLGGVLTGNMGDSLVTHRPVAELVGARLLNTVALGMIALIITLPLSLLVGVLAAQRRDRWFDKAFMGVSMVLNAVPDFVTATLLVALFSTTVLHLFPPVSMIPAGDMPWWHPAELVLPVTTMVLLGASFLSRLVRASFIDVMDSEYVQLARLKGLTKRRVVYRHALPNALAPAIPAASLMAGSTLAGVVIIEYLFNYPGIGSELVEAIGNHDLPVIQVIVLIMAVGFYVFNTIADMLSSIDRPTA